jgi:hypothetical protein
MRGKGTKKPGKNGCNIFNRVKEHGSAPITNFESSSCSHENSKYYMVAKLIARQPHFLMQGKIFLPVATTTA